MIYLLFIILGLQPPVDPPPIEPQPEISVCDTLSNAAPPIPNVPPPEILAPVDYSHCEVEVIIYDPPAQEPPAPEFTENVPNLPMLEEVIVVQNEPRSRFPFRWQHRK